MPATRSKGNRPDSGFESEAMGTEQQATDVVTETPKEQIAAELPAEAEHEQAEEPQAEQPQVAVQEAVQQLQEKEEQQDVRVTVTSVLQTSGATTVLSESSSVPDEILSSDALSAELAKSVDADNLLVFETQTVTVEEDEHGDTIITTVHAAPEQQQQLELQEVEAQSQVIGQVLAAVDDDGFQEQIASGGLQVRVANESATKFPQGYVPLVHANGGLEDSPLVEVDTSTDNGGVDGFSNGLHFSQDSVKKFDMSTSSASQCSQPCTFRPILTVIVGKGIKREPSDTEDEEMEVEEDDLSSDCENHFKQPKYVEYDCPKCPFFALTQAEVDEHIAQSHKALAKKLNAPPKERVKCELCEKTFARKYELQSHVKLVHLNMREYKCPDCDYCSSDKGRISKHRRTVHLKERKHTCPYCPFKSGSKSGVDAHVKARHTMERAWKCDHCDRRFVQKGQMMKHMQAVHLKLRKASCPYDGCGYKGLDEAAVKTHVKIKHIREKNHLCQECGYATTTRSQLNSHIQKKHVNKKRRKTKSIFVEGYKLKQPIHMFAV